MFKKGTQSLIRYMGSKNQIAAELLRFRPPRCRHCVEPFAGSAAVTLAARSFRMFETYIVNDVNSHHAAFLRTVQCQAPRFVQCLLRIEADSRDCRKQLWEETHRAVSTFAGQSDFEKAVNYYVCQRLSRNGTPLQGYGGTQRKDFTPAQIKDLLWQAWFLEDVEVREGDGFDLMDQGPDTFVFLDPPYPGKRYYIEGDRDHHSGFDHDRLIALFKNGSSRCMLTINWHELYEGVICHYPTIRKSMQYQSGNNARTAERASYEFIVMNY